MKTKLQLIIPALLLAAAIAGGMLYSRKAGALAIPTQTQDDGKKTRLERLKIETFEGEAATLRAKQLRRFHKGIARAMRDAEKRGLRQAFDKGRLILGTDPETPTNLGALKTSGKAFDFRKALFSSSRTMQDFSQDGYEITFLPYDDGDPNTWEGIIYRNGPDIDEDTRYAVIDIHLEEPQTLQDIYYPADGGEPREGGDRTPFLTRSNDDRRESTACAQSDGNGKASAEMRGPVLKAHQSSCPPPSHRCIGKEAMGCCGEVKPIDPWLRCSVSRSGGVAIACVRTGPAWVDCWTWGTLGGMFSCLF